MSYFIINLHHNYLPLPQAFPLLTASLSSSQTKYPNLPSSPTEHYNFSLFCGLHLKFGFVRMSSQAVWLWSNPYLVFKVCASVLTPSPTITNIINLSLTSGQFHPTLKESVIFPFSPLLKEPTLDKDQLITLSPMVFTILTSLPTASITQLKQLCCISMIISSMPSDHRSFHVFASLISLPLSTPLTIRVSSSSLLSIFLLVVFLKALFSVLYFLSCIPPHSALSPPHFL